MSLKGMIFAAGKGLKKHSPTLLLVMGIGGMLTSVVWAVKETPKAMRAIEDRQYENAEKSGDITHEHGAILPDLTAKETIGVAWRYYLPSAIIFAASVACLIGGHTVSAKRNAALASLYAVTETTLRQYKDAIVENVDSEVKEKIEDAVAQKQIQRASDPRDSKVYVSDGSGVLCYEPLSGRYFKSTKESIEKAVNELNHDMLCDGYGGTASLNDFYDKIGLPYNDIGEQLGWNTSNGLVEVTYSSQLAPDGTPALLVKYNKPPVYKYDKEFKY